jgi:hypothetical protein
VPHGVVASECWDDEWTLSEVSHNYSCRTTLRSELFTCNPNPPL